MEKPNRLSGSPLVLRTTLSVSRLKAQHVETKTVSSRSPGTILTSVASDQVQTIKQQLWNFPESC